MKDYIKKGNFIDYLWIVGAVAIHILEFVIKSDTYPYLFDLVVAAYSFAFFTHLLIHTTALQYQHNTRELYYREPNLRSKFKVM